MEIEISMEKKKIIAHFLFLFSFHLYSLEHRNYISLGVFGIDISSENENDGFNFSGCFINLSYQSSGGIGIDISPLHYSVNIKNPDILSLTFVNISAFYNFLKNDYFILGPFGSINAINYNRPDFIELITGIKFLIRNIDLSGNDFYRDSIFGFDLFAIEVGYKYSNMGRQGFYAFIGVDLLSTVYNHALNRKNDVKKYQKDQLVY
jgi:hypothetical protein